MIHILIVEDELIVAKDIEKKLQNLGYQVSDIVTTGEDAIKKAEEHHPDLILMDIRLEGHIDGIQAATTIKKTLKIPIIFVTALGDKETFSRAKITEPFGYIIKPFEKRELHSSIEIALYKHQVEQELHRYRHHLEELIDERTQELKQTNLSLQKEVKNRRNAELAALAHKKNLQNVIDSAAEIIIAFDHKHRIIIWNKSAELLTGFTSQQISQKPLQKTPVFYDPEQLTKTIDQIQKRKPTKFNELLLLTKDHAKRFLSISYSLIQNDSTNQMGILFIGKDITNLRKTQDNMQNGCCYLISHEDDTHVLDLFLELSQRKNQGLLMLRGTVETLQNLPQSKNIKIVLLSHHGIENVHTVSTITELITTIQHFYEQHPESVALLQGVHYLLTRFSFEEFINMVYELRELTSLYRAILLLKIDPVLFTNQQLAVLHHEIQSLPILYTDSILISQASYDILQFIYEKNQKNALVTIKDIAKKFSIVYRTASKRLDILKNMGLIVIKKYGRSRGVYVTEKAKTLIKNRKEPN